MAATVMQKLVHNGKLYLLTQLGNGGVMQTVLRNLFLLIISK